MNSNGEWEALAGLTSKAVAAVVEARGGRCALCCDLPPDISGAVSSSPQHLHISTSSVL